MRQVRSTTIDQELSPDTIEGPIITGDQVSPAYTKQYGRNSARYPSFGFIPRLSIPILRLLPRIDQPRRTQRDGKGWYIDHAAEMYNDDMRGAESPT